MKKVLAKERVTGSPGKPRCPNCGSQDVRRSSSEGVVATVYQMFGRQPYRCRSCRRRFYRPSGPDASYDDE